MVESHRVTIRLDDHSVAALQSLVTSGKYPNISEVMRAAIAQFIDRNFAPKHIEKITVELPRGNAVELQKLVRKGDSVSIDDAIRNAVREYLRRRLTSPKEKK
ncbi:MAG: ribbon-helix-helix protein, CopG family [Methanomassiliicoccales archaeon]